MMRTRAGVASERFDHRKFRTLWRQVIEHNGTRDEICGL